MFLEFPCLKQLNHLKNCWLEYSLYGLVLSTCYSEIKCQPPLQKSFNTNVTILEDVKISSQRLQACLNQIFTQMMEETT